MTKTGRIRKTIRKAMRIRQVGLGQKDVPEYEFKRTLQEALAVVTVGMKPEKAKRWAQAWAK